jgi:DNA-binding transcriptional regulator YhcF (GntR family)
VIQQKTAAGRPRTPFSTDPGDELPVGVQLSWRLRALIATGQLAAGERLPSFRRLAEWAGVNVNTVRAVYANLEDEGLVSSRQGQGTFVAADVEAAPRLEEIATDAMQRARDAGLSPRDLAIVAMAVASMPGALDEGTGTALPAEMPSFGEASEVIEVRHELRRQIGRLEAELASYARDLPRELPTARLRAEAHVAGVEELEQTRDTLIAQLSAAQRAAEERVRREGKARDLLKGKNGGTEPPASENVGGGSLRRAMSWWRAES